MADILDRKGSDMNASAMDRNMLSGETRKLLEALLLKAGEIGRVQVPTSCLLKDTGLTEGALMRARTELTQRHLLRTEPGFSASGLRGANVYVLNMLALDPPKEGVMTDRAAVDPVAVEPVVTDIREVDEDASEPSRHPSSGRKGLFGFFRRSGAAS